MYTIDHPTMQSPPPFGADVGVPSFSCSYPIKGKDFHTVYYCVIYNELALLEK